MICPKCGFEQPESPECVRCGVVVSRYKGPVASPAPGTFAPPPPVTPSYTPAAAAPPSGNETVRLTFEPPPPPPMMDSLYNNPAPALAPAMTPAMASAAPAMPADAGTVYGGPPPGGGTVYTGEGSGVRRTNTVVGMRGGGKLEPVKVLGEAFSIYFKNLLPFGLLTGIAMSPVLIAQGAMESSVGANNLTTLLPSALLMLAGMVVCPYIATSAITYGVFQQMRRQDTSIGDCLSRGLASLLPVLLLAIYQGILIFGGLLLCFIPGLLLMVRWAVSVPAAVEERPGIGASMMRSTFLTEGNRWEVFQVIFVLGLINVGLSALVGVAAVGNQTLALGLQAVQLILTVGLSATATAVMYYRLRSLKESIDVEEIASVFG